MSSDPFGAIETLSTPLGDHKIARLSQVGDVNQTALFDSRAPRVRLRNLDGIGVTEGDVKTIAAYRSEDIGNAEIPFIPGRVVLQDFTGVPAVVDLAAMRAAIVRMTDDAESAEKVNPAGAVRPGRRPLRPGRRLQPARRADHQQPQGVRAQPGALRVPQVGSVRPSRTSGSCRRPPASSTRSTSSISPRSSGTNGEWLYPDSLVGTDSPHHHDQRSRRRRMGCRRDRGRGGHARPAHFDAAARGGRLQADRQAAPREPRPPISCSG